MSATDAVTAESVLRAAGERLCAARAEETAARDALDGPIADAFRAGLPKRVIDRLSGLSPETVRRIARAAGVEPDPDYQVRIETWRASGKTPAREHVATLHAEGKTPKEIAAEAGVSLVRVYQLLKTIA